MSILKMIPTIPLLCFPVITKADLYVCESEIDGVVAAPTVLTKSHITKNSGIYFVVDSEEGIRESNGNKHTVEPCRISNEFLICMSIFEGIGINSLAIDTKNYTFTYVEQNYRVRVSSYYGTCIRGS